MDNVHDDRVWQETKNIVFKSVGLASLEIVKKVAISVKLSNAMLLLKNL